MKIHKIGLIAVLAAMAMLASSPVSLAQGKDAPKRERREAGPRDGALPPRMEEELKLTAAQKQKVEAAMKEQAEKTRALREDTNLTSEQRREKGRALREGMDKKMKEILTTEQYGKWQKLRQPGARGEGRPGGEKKRGERPPQS